MTWQFDPADKGGYVVMWRSIMEHPVWETGNVALFKVFAYCIMRANFKDGVAIDGTRIPRGSFIASIRTLADRCRISERQARTAMSLLEKLGILTHQTTHFGTILAVLNYDTYQIQQGTGDTAIDKPATQQRHTTDTAATHSNELKNEKRKDSSGVDPLVSPFAERIHARHPRARTCPLTQIKKMLSTIVRGHAEKGGELELLAAIDAKHERLCNSRDWQKNDGEYAKGLANWLAPTMDRWRPDDQPTLPEVRMEDLYRM